jgi:hypothetical protein
VNFQDFCYYPTSPGAVEEVDCTLAVRNWNKRNVFEQMIPKGLVHVHFRSGCEGVDIPWDLMTKPDLIVNFSQYFEGHRPIDISPEGIQQAHSYSLNREHLTFIPWGAIYALQLKGREWIVWEMDVPKWLHKQFEVLTPTPN